MLKEPLSYSGLGLDRVDVRRRDDAWIRDRLADPTTAVVPVWNDRSLVRSASAAAAVLLEGEPGHAAIAAANQVVLLGVKDGRTFFAAGLDGAEAPGFDGGAAFVELRSVSSDMATFDCALLAYARGMLFWHKRTRFCGDCGRPTESTSAGHIRVCTNPDCRREHFPRTDPAVIMLVTRTGPDGEMGLLARSHRFPPGRYSVLAGFVEPGETLEEAVAREVMEEAGVAVTDIRYRGSQPWPFPASLMLRFRARATTETLHLDAAELDDGGWYRKSDFRRLGEQGKSLPTLDSSARWLIEEWLAEGD